MPVQAESNSNGTSSTSTLRKLSRPLFGSLTKEATRPANPAAIAAAGGTPVSSCVAMSANAVPKPPSMMPRPAHVDGSLSRFASHLSICQNSRGGFASGGSWRVSTPTGNG